MKKYFMLIALCIMSSICFAQKTFENPDTPAVYPGGLQAMMKFVSDNYKYPEGVEGRVIISFVVDTDGSVTDIRPMKSPDERATDEAIRVLKMMPKWTPAQEKGKVVKMRFTMPISLKPNKNQSKADSGKGITIEGCEKIAKEGAGHSENPKGLYRLLTLQPDNYQTAQLAPAEQYKYCGDSLTLQMEISKDVKDSGDKTELQFYIHNNDRKALTYTGYKADKEEDCIYDSDAKTFKFRWYNNRSNFGELMPYEHAITEMYSSDYGVDPRVKHAMNMLEGKFNGKNKLTGCWHRLGVIVKVDGMDMIVPGHQELYHFFDDDVYMQYYDLMPGRLSGYFILRPVTYISDTKIKQYGSENDIEWISDNTFKLNFDRGDGTIVTELWKRSGMPKDFQRIFGTDIPVYEIVNPLPNYFGPRTSNPQLVSVVVKSKKN